MAGDRCGRRVLLAWERGGNLGHIASLLPIARRLRERGAEPLFAVPGPGLAREFLAPEGFRFVRAPLCLPTDSARPPDTFADLLLAAGFSDVGLLHELVLAWHELFDAAGVGSVLLDYAPVAQFAAWLRGMNCAAIVTGFNSPPIPCPSIRPWIPQPAGLLAESERKVLRHLNEVAARFGCPRTETLTEWLHAPKRFMLGLPETAIFGAPPDVVFLGPLGELPGQRVEWTPGGAPQRRILAYLQPARYAEALLRILARSGCEVVCAAPRFDAEAAARLSPCGVRVVPHAVDLKALLPSADLVINYGSLGIACQALLAGKPQLMIPADAEKALATRRIASMGAGIGLTPASVANHAESAIERLLSTPSFGQAAGRVAEVHGSIDWNERIEQVVDSVIPARFKDLQQPEEMT